MAGLLSGRALKSRLMQPRDEIWDRRLGVRTFGYHEGRGDWGAADWASHYQPLSYHQIFAGLAAAGAGPDDHLTDLGCGLGRAMFAAAYAGVGCVTGVELMPALARACEANRRGSRLADRDIRVIEGDALEHDLGDTTILYFFHALSAQIMARVLENARDGRRAGRPFRLIYANPVFDHVIADAGWLRRIAELPPRREWLSLTAPYATTVWAAD